MSEVLLTSRLAKSEAKQPDDDEVSHNNFFFENKSEAPTTNYMNYPNLINSKEDIIVLDDDESVIDLNIIQKYRESYSKPKVEKDKHFN